MASRAELITVVVSVAIAAVFAVPFGYLVVRALGDPAAAWAAVADDSTLGPLWRSVQLAVLVTAGTAVIGVALAWLTMRTDLPGRRAWRVAVVLPLVIPSFVGAHAFVSLFASGGLLEVAFGVRDLPDVRGLFGATVVLVGLSYPLVYLPVAARMAGLPPSLEESARLLGRSTPAIFRSVVLPQCATAIAAGALLVTLYCLSDFGAVQFVGYDTLTRRIYAARLDPITSVSVSLLLGVLALAVAVGERVLRRRLPATGGVGTKRAVVHRLGRWRSVAVGVVVAVVGLTLVAPVAVLTWWVVRGRTSSGRRSRVVDLGASTWSSATMGVISALVTVAVVLPLAVLVVRQRGRLAGTVGSVVMAGFALPGIVIALALVRLFVGTPVYQTLPLLVAAYVLHFGGQGLSASQSAVGAVPLRYGEAARLLGAGPIRRLLTVDLRLMLPGLAAAGGLVMLSVLKELPATLMLRPPGFNTLATRIAGTVEEALLIDAGQLSLVLIALSAVLTWVLVIRRMTHLPE